MYDLTGLQRVLFHFLHKQHHINIRNNYYNILCPFSEINECSEGSDNCDQTCYNTASSYTCSCRSGYTLGSDRRTCNGMITMVHGYRLAGVVYISVMLIC